MSSGRGEGKEEIGSSWHGRSIDAAQSILNKNNPIPNVILRDEGETMPNSIMQGQAILETSGEGDDIDMFDAEIAKADSHSKSPAVVRPTSGGRSRSKRSGSSGLMSAQTVGALPEVKSVKSSALLNQQRAGSIGSSSGLGKSITSSASKHAQSKGEGGGVESKSGGGDRGGAKAVADPVPSPQGVRKLRPQSAQRRRPSLTPNLDIIPEARNVAAIAGEPVNPDHYQALNIGDVKNVSATCHDARRPLDLVIEHLLEASTNMTDSASVMGAGIGSDLFTDNNSGEAKAGGVSAGEAGEEAKGGQESSKSGGGSGRRPSFSSNGLLGETGGEDEEELDIDRIGHLKAPPHTGKSIGSSPGGLKGSLSMGNLNDIDHPSMAHTSLKVGAAGQISTSIAIAVKDAMGGGSISIPRNFPGLGALGGASREGSRPSSSSRNRQRMFWCSTGLSTQTLHLTFFTGWNLHKVTLAASGVEQCVLYPKENDLPATVGREVQRKQGRGIIGANLGPARMGGTVGASSASAFPSLDEDREYAPAKGELGAASPSVGSRYNIEEDYNDQDSTSESESDDGSSSRYGAGGRGGRGRGRRTHALQLETFEFTFGNLIEASRSVKCINLAFTLKPGADFMVVKALSIGASPGEL